jgi:hypothetical protein
MLPDLLKNNYLDDSALILVKSLEDIDEIWDRLKGAFGEPKIMLSIKLEEMNKISNLGRGKSHEKVLENLQSIINLMKDLTFLAETHKIENDLYFGDSLDRIFKLLGEARTTRWISETYDRNLPRKESWNNLILFLEKEVKIILQKIIILGNDTARIEQQKEGSHRREDMKGRRGDGYHAERLEEKGNSDTCAICGKDDHVSTIGPNQSKIIQYFACQQFAEMKPSERFDVIRSKGLCWQCLFPGALVKHGKHNEGKCQRDFVCQHPSHQRYKVKKHVLLCDEHKHSSENSKILDLYKSKCILREREASIPDFSKEIQLCFHNDVKIQANLKNSCKNSHVSSLESEDVVTAKSLYQLQIINVDGKDYSLFFDNGCGDFVSRYKAITQIGKRANQEFQGCVQIGGVGGASLNKYHAVYLSKFHQLHRFAHIPETLD